MNPRELLAALNVVGGVSGIELAQQFGVTRAAVWKRIAQLRDWGIAVEGRPGAGYVLTAPLDLLEASAIRAAMDPRSRKLLGTLDVELDLESTNSAMSRAEARGAPSGSVLFAERQSHGRGRRGRVWQSPFGASVYMSVLWRFERGLAALGGLSLAVGIATAEALQALGAASVQLKWPNDLLHGERKLGGILIDAGGEWTGACHAVIGIGLNVRIPELAAAHIDQPWIDMLQVLENVPPRSRIAGGLLAQLLPAMQEFDQHGLASCIDRWPRLDALSGRAITVHAGANSWPAVAEGIDSAGALRARDAHGKLHHLAAAEVSIRMGSRG